jgi:cell division protein FtsQ
MRLKPFFRRFRSDFFAWAKVVVVAGGAVAIVVGGVWAAYAEAWPAMVSHSYFRLRSVKVACDSRAAEPSALAARAGLYDGTSLWQIDTEHGREALAAVPWVRAARVERRFPDEVSVEVLRREPVAATVTKDGPFLIDRDGVIYREGETVPYMDLPYLTGWDRSASRGERVSRLRTEMAIVRAVQDAGIAVSQLDVDAEGIFRLYPENPSVAVVLGSAPRPSAVAQRLLTVWKALPERADDLREIDLSYTDRAVLRTHPGRTSSVISAMAGTNDVRDRVTTATPPEGAHRG